MSFPGLLLALALAVCQAGVAVAPSAKYRIGWEPCASHCYPREGFTDTYFDFIAPGGFTLMRIEEGHWTSGCGIVQWSSDRKEVVKRPSCLAKYAPPKRPDNVDKEVEICWTITTPSHSSCASWLKDTLLTARQSRSSILAATSSIAVRRLIHMAVLAGALHSENRHGLHAYSKQ
ncbi:uncharacterized protein L969DRAFT_370391 [Mixia osmundae IAM 14324]|uniref:uncharacterized protein n=1 Tax=Mixia osmundae (strain CBS 9802 / IAM 14324 / JCM 22182 / KY 12970) TaxID=764103 RepID=UPI0004A55793|nr:uncharacterized protein L969DRAFT_370391 [Mixia osmundae IAM 14324]KEI41022.1 hypothetical protein L969DRAFT_370391 [Mixia osmundae IAM 14324]